MTIRVMVTGEPEEIAAFFATVDKCECMTLTYQSDISKRASHHKTGSARAAISVDFVKSAKVDVVIYERRKRKSDKRNAPTKGFVYVMPAYDVNGQTGYKIGKTVNPKSRKKTFSVKMPYKVDFIGLFETDDYTKLEVSLHTEFREKRINGEFFALNDDDLRKLLGRMTPSDIKKLASVQSYYRA